MSIRSSAPYLTPLQGSWRRPDERIVEMQFKMERPRSRASRPPKIFEAPDVPKSRSHHAVRRSASAELDRGGNGRSDASHVLFADSQLQPRLFAGHLRCG